MERIAVRAAEALADLDVVLAPAPTRRILATELALTAQLENGDVLEFELRPRLGF